MRKRERERESERAHIHQAKPIDTQSLEQGALEEAGGPQQRGGISSGRTSEEALLFVWFPEACTFLSVSFNPLSDVVHQHMSTLNLGLLMFMAAFLQRRPPGAFCSDEIWDTVHFLSLSQIVAAPQFEKCVQMFTFI